MASDLKVSPGFQHFYEFIFDTLIIAGFSCTADLIEIDGIGIKGKLSEYWITAGVACKLLSFFFFEFQVDGRGHVGNGISIQSIQYPVRIGQGNVILCGF